MPGRFHTTILLIGSVAALGCQDAKTQVSASNDNGSSEGDVKRLPRELAWTAIILDSGIFPPKAEDTTKNFITLPGQPLTGDGTNLGVVIGFGKEEKQFYHQALFGGTQLNIEAVAELAGTADKVNKDAIPIKPSTFDEYVFGPISLGVDPKTGTVVAVGAPGQYWKDGLRKVAQTQRNPTNSDFTANDIEFQTTTSPIGTPAPEPFGTSAPEEAIYTTPFLVRDMTLLFAYAIAATACVVYNRNRGRRVWPFVVMIVLLSFDPMTELLVFHMLTADDLSPALKNWTYASVSTIFTLVALLFLSLGVAAGPNPEPLSNKSLNPTGDKPAS